MTNLLNPSGDTPQKVAVAVNQALKGKVNSVGSVTLTAGAATTTVENALCSASSGVFLIPTTSNAAADFGAGTFYVVPGDGSFVIHHANDADVDKVFNFAILG